MITVIETWYLKDDFTDQALQIMQEMDDLVGPNAHEDPGWHGHAQFFQRADDVSQVFIVYPWRSREMHERLSRAEEPLLAAFTDKYCQRPRTFEYVTELPVEVEHDHR